MPITLDRIIFVLPLITCVCGVIKIIYNKVAKQIKMRHEKQDKQIDLLKDDVSHLKDEVSDLKIGLQAILRGELIDNHTKYMRRGSIPNYALENCERLYTAYKANNGNGFAKTLMVDIRNLDVKITNNVDKIIQIEKENSR